MNVQVKTPYEERWRSYGDVTIEEAVIEHARKKMWSPQTIVHARFKERPKVVWTMTVVQVLSYKIEGLRGGE